MLRRCYTMPPQQQGRAAHKQSVIFPQIHLYVSMVLPWILMHFFFLRAKIQCERCRIPPLWDNKSCHVHAWRHLSFQSSGGCWAARQCCWASAAPGTEALSCPILLGAPGPAQNTPDVLQAAPHPLPCRAFPSSTLWCLLGKWFGFAFSESWMACRK